MPIIDVRLSQKQAKQIGKENRYRAGIEWRGNLSKTTGLSISVIAVWWTLIFDSLNPVEGPELLVYFSDDELRKIKVDDPDSFATQIKEGLVETSRKSSFLPKGMEVGAWAVPLHGDKWGHCRVGLPPLTDESESTEKQE